MIIKNPKEMMELGEKLAKEHKKILLHGDLWAGKTLFTKGFAKWMWIMWDKVQSPTYAYINTYDNKLLHIDMYRIDEFDELVEKWIIDQINDFENIIIERPKFIDKLPIEDFLVLTIEKISESERSINID